MDTSNILSVVSIIIQALTCLLFLLGVGAGVYALVRKNKTLGILSIVGFILLGVYTLTNIVIYRIIYPTLTNYQSLLTYNWIDLCLGSTVFLLGIIAIVVGIFLSSPNKAASSKELTAGILPPEPPII
jgi:hypothetical protein